MSGIRMLPFSAAMLVIAAVLIVDEARAAAAGTYHAVTMRGSILGVNGTEVYLCIGHKDGAKAGQRFEVFNMLRHATPRSGGSGAPSASFTKQKTGVVEIIGIVDEHFARGKIVSGSANKGYIVELDFPKCTCK